MMKKLQAGNLVDLVSVARVCGVVNQFHESMKNADPE
jgi:hypothetical protein